MSPSFDEIHSMRAPPTPGSLSHSSSVNLNDSLGIHDSYNSQTPSTPHSHQRHSDNYKSQYNNTENTEYMGSSSTTTGYNENVDIGGYPTSNKFTQPSFSSTVSNVNIENVVAPASNPSNISNILNSRASSYVVSISFLTTRANRKTYLFIHEIKSANDIQILLLH